MRKILIILLSVLCLLFTTMGLVACGNKESKQIETLTTKVTYRVNDSIYVYDLFKWKDGQKLSFTYTIDGGESNDVKGDFIYLKTEGKYNITALESENNTKNVEVLVTNPLSRMYLENEEITVDFEAVMGIKTIINRAAPFIKSEFAHNEFVEKVWIYKGELNAEPLVYDLIEGEPGADGMFDGKKFTFKYECDYVFRVYSETSGGRVYADLRVHCIEDLSRLEDLSNKYAFTFDDDNYTASWDAVNGAVHYRVKYAGQTKIITETDIDISSYLTEDWYHFDFAVIPVDKGGEKLGKFVREDVIKAPKNSKDVILGGGVSSIDGNNMLVTLKGRESYGAGYRTEIHATLDNSYIAFCNNKTGKYGVGTVAEFTFKGNNMPQVCFFADKLNGDITEYGGSGWLFMNGLYTTNKSSASSSTTNVVGENSLVLLGPNRIGDNHSNYITVSEQRGEYTVSKNTLLTQKFLRGNPEQEFRYKVRSFNQEGFLAFEAILEDAVTGDIVTGPAVKVTTTKIEDVKPGYIIAYATVKGDGVDTTFNYKSPYEYVDYSDPDAKYFGAIFTGENTVNMAAGSHPNVSSMQGSTWGDGWISGIANYSNNYVGFENVWSVGKAVDLTFSGNNMPIITIFANSINGNMSGSLVKNVDVVDQNGYLISNGIYDVTADPDVIHGDNKLTVFGPNRINSNLNTVSGNVSTIGGSVYSGLQEDVDYKYTVASIVENNKVSIILELYDTKTSTLISVSKYETGKTEAEIEDLGKGIIFYAGVKGNGTPTKFFYSEIYDYNYTEGEFDLFGGTINSNGSVTLSAGTHSSVSSLNGSIWGDGWRSGVSLYKNNYIAFKNVSEVGKFIDFTFTGNNMPIVTLFADKITQSMGGSSTGADTTIDQNGYVISNGLYDVTTEPDTIWGKNKISVAGPNRISVNPSLLPTATILNGEYGGLTDGTNYRYSVGSQLEGTEVIIVIELYNDDTDTLICRATYNTGKTEIEIESFGANLIAYAGVKGNSLTTTFKYSEVYDKKVNIPVSQGATLNADGSVTLAAGTHLNVSSMNGSIWDDGWNSGVSAYKNNYIAFKNVSEVGNYMDFIFTGNNMPIVTLFADQITQSMGADTTGDNAQLEQNGYVISNGLYDVTKDPAVIHGGGKISIAGPNRISVSAGSIPEATVVIGSYNGLDEVTNYKYTIGSQLQGTEVIIVVELYNVDTTSLIYRGYYNTGKTEEQVENLGTHIIAYAGVKGNSLTTTFKYSEAYVKNVNIPVSQGVTLNADGTVTLAPGTHEKVSSQTGAAWSDGWGSGISAFKNNYIAFEGVSKVGNYIDFYFTGNNMPQVTMFAGEINTCVGASTTSTSAGAGEVDNTGYYISNGIYEATGQRTLGEGLIFVYGYNRVYNNPSPAEVTTSNIDTLYGGYNGLVEGTQYKYTVGSKEESGKVLIVIELYEVEGDNESLIYSGTYNTNKTTAEVEAIGTHIIAYAGIKGNNLTTTFKYSEVYTPN